MFGLVNISATTTSGFLSPVLSELSYKRANASYGVEEMSWSFLIGIMEQQRPATDVTSFPTHKGSATTPRGVNGVLYALQASHFHDVTVSAHAEQQICDEARCPGPLLTGLGLLFLFLLL